MSWNWFCANANTTQTTLWLKEGKGLNHGLAIARPSRQLTEVCPKGRCPTHQRARTCWRCPWWPTFLDQKKPVNAMTKTYTCIQKKKKLQTKLGAISASSRLSKSSLLCSNQELKVRLVMMQPEPQKLQNGTDSPELCRCGPGVSTRVVYIYKYCNYM